MSKQVILMPTPANTRGVYAIGAHTGALTATLATNHILFSFQWTNATHYAVMDYFDLSVAVLGEITTGVVMGLQLLPVRDYFNPYTGGTDLFNVPATDPQMKMKSNFPLSLAADIRIATVGELSLPLVPGTEDSQPIADVIFGIGNGTDTATTPLPKTILYKRETNSFPFVMDTNEGLDLVVSRDGPATGTLIVGVNMRWLECTKATF